MGILLTRMTHRRRRDQINHRKIIPLVCPKLLPRQPGFVSQLCKSINRVFVRVFGEDRLACEKLEGMRSDLNRLPALTDKTQIDAMMVLIVKCPMRESLHAEIGAQLAIDSREQIQIELRSNSQCIVVGRFDDRHIFLQIDADEQAAIIAA